MRTESLALSQLKVGESLIVSAVGGESAMKRRLEDLGVVEGAQISCLMQSPLGDPRAYWICGAVIALRAKDAEHVTGLRFREKKEPDVWD